MKNSNILEVLFFYFLMFISVSAAANLDKIVAVVNNEVITQKELNEKIQALKKHTKIPADKLRKQALDDLIDLTLQLQLANLNNIVIGDKDLDKIIADIAENNGMTVVELKESIPRMEGISYKQFRTQLRQQVTVSRLQQQVLGGEIKISDQEVEQFLRNPPKSSVASVRYHLIDILLEIPDGASTSQVKRTTRVAEQMMAKIKNGEDIDKAVESAQSKAKGQEVKSIDLEWRTVNDLPELFAKEVAKMRVNQIIGPIKAPNGLHVLKLLGVNGLSPQAGSVAKNQAREIIFHKKLMEKLKPWLKEQRSKAHIDNR